MINKVQYELWETETSNFDFMTKNRSCFDTWDIKLKSQSQDGDKFEPRPNQTEFSFTFMNNPWLSWGSCRGLSQLDKSTTAVADLNDQSKTATSQPGGVT